ncbi:hypothetical protein BO70DRAFT_393147 [Aspergillus heteromorphus CBS 117.55]|uniref:Glyceraldehyde 3-phosphate dehydrogenase n=1 Tax=Aspergillus heteromorphus CBS 117.55 TaxID=1448321 RepID=A0A317WV43_9EURO|nr:uncharacterized protein BO70DRAFT_393147 [Aspergillus heteromorphus CBS 117.55]PWY89955.1 hypothetical protein BO70DRAFT_393147 [Aspergillus heteromorphus CBS 117.55]
MGVMKDGWHPKGRDGKKESWRNDFKGINQVAGWMGKGKDKDDDASEHVSAPLSSLKDPASFGPPPKHIKYHGAGALPNELTPDRNGLGAPLSREQINHQNTRQQQEEQRVAEEAQRPAAPPVPYRVNRTGLDTSNLPPPPVRRMDSPAEMAAPSPRPKPNLPPRLPSRNNSTPSPTPHSPTPPPAYSPQVLEGHLNQEATSRLSQAGVSVPAFGIGNGGSQWRRDSNGPGVASPTTAGSVGQTQVNELQNRFSHLRTSSSNSPAPPPPARGNSFATQPSPVSTSDTRSASSTINDFRERHNDKIQAGKQKISGLNEKYGISQRVKALGDQKSPSSQAPPPVPPHPNANRSTSSLESETLGRKKAPPPPPPKKAGMRSMPVPGAAPSPPPLPLSTKPR